MSAEIRRQLLALMGPSSLGGPLDQSTFLSPEVCKMYIKGACMHDLFTNTKKDMGVCPKMHSPKHKEEFEKEVKEGKQFPEIEREWERTLGNCAAECDNKVRLASRKLKQQQERACEDPIIEEKIQIAQDYDMEITTLVEQVEKLGLEGSVNAALGVYKKAEEVRAKKEVIEKELKDAGFTEGMSQQQKLRVCEVCSAFLSVIDSPRRLADHFGGKLHLGYLRVRELLKEHNASRPASRLREESRPASKEDFRPAYDNRPPSGRGGYSSRGAPPPRSRYGGPPSRYDGPPRNRSPNRYERGR